MNKRPSKAVTLPRILRQKLALPRALARRDGFRLALVGGAVRDLLLRRAVGDLDLVVEGDAMVLARRLAARQRIPLRLHERFATATLELPDGSRMDLATSRRETYERPGALPRVSPATIEEDLSRRDFSINAMALEIAPGRFLRLLDPLGGREDLRRGLIRLLHPGSAFDDPTRAFRAARYANRLGFDVEAGTRRRIREALRQGAFQAVSGDRLRRETRLLFSESRRAGAVRWMGRLGLASTLRPALRCDATTLSRLRRAELLAATGEQETDWLLYLLVWAADLSSGDLEALSDRLNLGRDERRRVRGWRQTREDLWAELRGREAPRGQREFCPDEILAAAAVLPGRVARQRLDRMLAGKTLELAIGGRELLAAGVPSGPSVGRALARTLSARQQGTISREQELDFALRAAREPSP